MRAKKHGTKSGTGARSGGAFLLPQPWHHGSMRALAVTSDLDIYRSANVLVKQHGEDAPIHAATPCTWRRPLCGTRPPTATIGVPDIGPRF